MCPENYSNRSAKDVKKAYRCLELNFKKNISFCVKIKTLLPAHLFNSQTVNNIAMAQVSPFCTSADRDCEKTPKND